MAPWAFPNPSIPSVEVLTSGLAQPLLTVVVDTEEEFDWSKPFDRSQTSVEAMRQLHRFQTVCDRRDIKPTYVVDYPVATQKAGMEALVPIFNEDRANIGAHLHPWVNPPHKESVTAEHSFPGNLPIELESEKLTVLIDALEDTFGSRPMAYKAGRYGLGPNSFELITKLGIDIDLSPCPPWNFSDQAGPNYTACSANPYWVGKNRELLVIPTTGAYVGWLAGIGDTLHSIADSSVLRKLRAPGILARSGAVDRLLLSPEGFTLEENQRLVKALFSSGHRIFNLALHSPSLEVGRTPYVRSEKDLHGLLDSLGDFFDFFISELGGIVTDPLSIRKQLTELS